MGLRADKGFAMKAAGKRDSTVTLATRGATAAQLLRAEWPRGLPPCFLPAGHSWRLGSCEKHLQERKVASLASPRTAAAAELRYVTPQLLLAASKPSWSLDT